MLIKFLISTRQGVIHEGMENRNQNNDNIWRSSFNKFDCWKVGKKLESCWYELQTLTNHVLLFH